MEGIKLVKKDNYTIAIIEVFSSELRDSIRRNLSSICNGEIKANSGKANYCYKRTVDFFFNEKLKSKDDDQRMGLMAELLIHILIIEEIDEFLTVSPFFNLETNHPKHGFDLINYKKQEGSVWFTEVKSGRKQSNTSDESINLLIERARNNLKDRLNENKNILWRNAINSVIATMDNSKDAKSAIIKILEEFDDAAYQKEIDISEINVILAGCLFGGIDNEISEDNISNKYNDELSKGFFREVYLIAIQKNTFEKIYEFIESEANDE